MGLGAQAKGVRQGWQDTIIGGLRNDILKAGGGAEGFIFGTGTGQDHICAFKMGPCKIANQSRAATFAALTIPQSGAHTVISFGTIKITLDGIDDATVTAASFRFADVPPRQGKGKAAALTASSAGTTPAVSPG